MLSTSFPWLWMRCALLIALVILLLPFACPVLFCGAFPITLLNDSPASFAAGVTVGPLVTWPAICNQTAYIACKAQPEDANVLVIYGVVNSQLTSNVLQETIDQLQAVVFYLDVINAQGGVIIGNQSYLLQFHYQFDDGSEDIVYDLFGQWWSNTPPNIIYAPIEDDLLSTAMSLYNVSYNAGSGTKFVFGGQSLAPTAVQNPGGYPFYFNNLSPANQQVTKMLDLIDQRAALFYWEQQQGSVSVPQAGASSVLTSSSWGITTIAVYYTQYAYAVTACTGVLEWINATNTARTAANATATELISLIAELQFQIADVVLDSSNFQPAFELLPPYNLDLLVVCGAPLQSSGVVEALAASKVQPKAFAWVSDILQFDQSNPTVVAGLDGIISFGIRTAAESLPSTLPGVMFTNRIMAEAMYAAYVGVAPSIIALRTLAAWEMMLSCVTQSSYSYSVLDPVSLWFSTVYTKGRSFFNDVNFQGQDVSSQTNVGYNDMLVTRQFSGNNYSLPVLIASADALLYPVPWPWYTVLPGDTLVLQSSTASVLVGVVFVVLGAWVALIIVEQAVFERRRGGWHQPWLFMVAFMLAGAGAWCSVFMQVAGLSLYKTNDLTDALPMTWSLSIALLAVLVGTVVTFAGLLMLITDVDDGSQRNKHRSDTAQMRMQHKEEKTAMRKLAALSHRAHALQLLHSVSWRVIVSGLIIAAAIAVQRYILMWSVQAAATWEIGFQAWLILALCHGTLLPLTLLLFLHAVRWRLGGVLLFSCAVLIDYHVSLKYTTYHLSDAVSSGSITWGIGSNITVSSLAVNLIAGITAACTCFLFVSLQFSRMQLSRNGLALLVANLEHMNHQLKLQLRHCQQLVAQQQEQADALVSLLDCITLCRPLPQEFAFAMAVSSNTSTFRNQLAPLLEAADACSGSKGKESSSGTPINMRRRQPAPAIFSRGGTTTYKDVESTSRLPVHHAASRGSSGYPVAPAPSQQETEKAAPAEVPPSDGVTSETEVESLDEHLEDASLQSAAQVVNPPPGPPQPSAQPPPPSTLPSAAFQQHSDKRGSVVQSATSPVRNTWLSFGAVVPDPEESRPPAAVAWDGTAASDEDAHGGALSPQSRVSTSAGSVSTTVLLNAAVYAFDHGTRLKAYESDIGKQMLAQLQHRAQLKQKEPTQDAALSKQQSKAGSAIFPLTQSIHGERPTQRPAAAALNRATITDSRTLAVNLRRELAVSPSSSQLLKGASPIGSEEQPAMEELSWPLPTLNAMLMHPVCVEILKDALTAIHSEENLMFFLHAVRYRQLRDGRLRARVAKEIFQTFVAEHSSQQININTRQREKIAATIRAAPADMSALLFEEAEREVRLLIETNLMKTFQGSEGHRLAAFVMQAVSLRVAAGLHIADQNNDSLAVVTGSDGPECNDISSVTPGW